MGTERNEKSRKVMLSILEDQNAMLKALHESEKKFRILFESSVDALGVSKDGKHVFVNPAYLKLFGYEKNEDFIGESILSLIAESKREEIISLVKKTESGESVPNSYETLGLKKNGTEFIMEVHFSTFNMNSETHTLAIIRDITERKKTEETLIEYQKRLLKAEEIGHLGFLDWNLSNNEIFVSAEVIKMFGLRNKNYLVPELLEEIVYPEDREFVRDNLNAAIKNEKLYNIDHRIVRPNGEIRWVQAQGELIFNPDGKPGRFLGTVLDITERKKSEQILKESETKFRLAFKTSPDAINITRLSDGKIFEVNDGFTTLTGYSTEEIIGKKTTDIDIWANPKDRQKLINILNKKGIIKDFEFKRKMKGGKIAYTLISAVVILLNNESYMISIVRDINKQKIAEEELKNSAIKLNSSQKLAKIGDFTWDINSGEVTWSEGMYELLGYDKNEEIDLAKVNSEIHHPDDLERVTKWLNECINSGNEILIPNEYRLVRKEGKVITVHTEGRISYKKGKAARLFGMCQDITERKLAESELRESERRFRKAVLNAPFPVMIHADDGNVELINDEWQKITGYTFEEINTIDKWVEMAYGEKSDFYINKIQKIYTINEKLDEGEYKITTKSGDKRIWHFNSVPLGKSIKGRQLFKSMAIDVTERKETEKEIQKLNDELEKRVLDRTRQLENANKELESFSYSISHDLRAPLRAINGFSQIILENHSKNLDKEVITNFRKVLSASHKMEELIDGILNLSRVTRLGLKLKVVNLSEIAEEISKILITDETIRKKQIVIEPDIEVIADQVLMKSVLQNLFDNAIKFSASKENSRIEFGSIVLDNECTYYIKDNGAGFNIDYADKLFIPFQRLHSEREFTGTGIGLATVKKIIKKHGGKIWATGKVNEGATFYFTLNAELIQNY